jgi:hypothetical protein
MWIMYDCQTHNASLGLHWQSTSDEFDLADMNVNLVLISPSHYIWHIQRNKIEQFILITQRDELERLNEALPLTPTSALYIW